MVRIYKKHSLPDIFYLIEYYAYVHIEPPYAPVISLLPLELLAIDIQLAVPGEFCTVHVAPESVLILIAPP